jgi:GNAT superfamily N-acetyltransferase
MDKYRIVEATRERMTEVARMFRQSFRSTYPEFPSLHTAEEDATYFADVVFLKSLVYVAEEIETAKILGFIAFDSSRIDHLYLLPEAQRQGLGSQLLALAKRDSDKLQLWTFQQNHVARAFYEKHVFREIKLTDGAENEEKQPDVLMEWSRLR